MIAGIVVLPAILEALVLLSPATNSYPLIDFLTMIGSNTPCSLIDSANSSKAS